MFGTGQKFQVARVAGIPIYLSYSWFAIAALFGFFTYADFATGFYKDQALLLTVITLVLFFGSILLHEGAHALAARGFGLPVRGITLVFWGGATETRSWRKGPFADFVVAAAGPATTLVLGVLFVFIAQQMTPYTGLHHVVDNLGRINLFFAVLNAIPGFPLDGGRMLMALAWGITRNRALAYRVAGVGSLLVGAAFIVWAVMNFGRNGLAIFAGYLGFVMIGVGRQIPGQAVLRERLQRGTARDAMQPIGAMIAADSTVHDATERWLRPFPEQLFPVQEGGRIVGAVSLEDAADTAASRPVSEAMVRFDDPPVIDDTEPLDDVVDWIGVKDGLVTDITGHTVGMISVQDIDRWLRAHWSTGQYMERPFVVEPPRPDQ
jgi:Zn-dependent protease